MENILGVNMNQQITPLQILKLEKAIGYDLRNTVKRGVLRITHNFHDGGIDGDPAWNALCALGLAESDKAFGRTIYRVTERGIELISTITGCRIYKARGMWDGREEEADA